MDLCGSFADAHLIECVNITLFNSHVTNSDRNLQTQFQNSETAAGMIDRII